MGSHDLACVHRGGGRWAGSNKVVELKKKKKEYTEQNLCQHISKIWHQQISRETK